MEARGTELDAACKLFMERLTGPGDFLTGARRSAIAQEAAWTAGCPARSEFRQGGKGPALVNHVTGLDQNCPGSSIIGCLVHCQDVLNAEWYEAAVDTFAGELGSLGEFRGGQDERVACLTELVLVVAGTIGARKFYSASGMPIPNLPPTTEGAPLFERVSEFCSGKLDRTGYAWGFQVMRSDIVASGLEKIGQSPSEWIDNTIPSSPYSKMTPTPLSMSHQHAWMKVVYVQHDFDVSSSARAPPGRCLDRSTMELVAGTYAGAVHCDF